MKKLNEILNEQCLSDQRCQSLIRPPFLTLLCHPERVPCEILGCELSHNIAFSWKRLALAFATCIVGAYIIMMFLRSIGVSESLAVFASSFLSVSLILIAVMYERTVDQNKVWSDHRQECEAWNQAARSRTDGERLRRYLTTQINRINFATLHAGSGLSVACARDTLAYQAHEATDIRKKLAEWNCDTGVATHRLTRIEDIRVALASYETELSAFFERLQQRVEVCAKKLDEL